MNDLTTAIEAVIPNLCTEWNTVKLPQFENLVEQSFAQYFAGRQTQEKTKMVAPILDSVFARLMKQSLPNFDIDEGIGRDYIWNEIPLESKITFGLGKGWVGNGYAKTPWHILMRFRLTDDGIITAYFASLVDLDQCQSKWTEPGLSSNFSGLEFLKEDKDKIIRIHGDFTETKKYLMPILVEIQKTTEEE